MTGKQKGGVETKTLHAAAEHERQDPQPFWPIRARRVPNKILVVDLSNILSIHAYIVWK